jgi:hypothetical protein
MSHLLVAPEFLASAATDLAGIGSALNAANAAAALRTTGLLAAAEDEVSAAVAALFAGHAQEYQALSAQVSAFHQQFVQSLTASGESYAAADAVAAAAADTRITVPGAGPLYFPRFITELPYLGQILLQGGVAGPPSVSILQGYDLLNHAIGQNWFPGSLAQVVNYPASVGLFSGSPFAPTVNEAVAIGQQMLHAQIMNAVANGNGNPVHIAGLSMGTIVIDRELAYLAADPTAPLANQLQFTLFSSPELGLARTYLPTGFTVPFINYTAGDLPVTKYDVSVVFGQYDFWGNPPDRPWNLLADVNSLFGALYFHDPASLAYPSNAVALSSVTNSLGGTVTTYMVPSPTLPMLLPLKQIGMQGQIVDFLNSVLQPMVDSGYSSLTPGAGPYFSGGALVGLPIPAS